MHDCDKEKNVGMAEERNRKWRKITWGKEKETEEDDHDLSWLEREELWEEEKGLWRRMGDWDGDNRVDWEEPNELIYFFTCHALHVDDC